jgi:hypothetical protein
MVLTVPVVRIHRSSVLRLCGGPILGCTNRSGCCIGHEHEEFAYDASDGGVRREPISKGIRPAATSTRPRRRLSGPSQVASPECAHAKITDESRSHDDGDHRRSDHSDRSRLRLRQHPPGLPETICCAARPGSLDCATSSDRVVACHRRVHAGARGRGNRVRRGHREQRARRHRRTHDAPAATSRGAGAERAACPWRIDTGGRQPDRWLCGARRLNDARVTHRPWHRRSAPRHPRELDRIVMRRLRESRRAAAAARGRRRLPRSRRLGRRRGGR